MAREIQLPCDGEGVCMRCKNTPRTDETLMCSMCVTPWHISCLSSEFFTSSEEWQCPDCSGLADPAPVSGNAAFESSDQSNLVAAIRAIEADESLTDAQKAKKRQKLMSGGQANDGGDDDVVKDETKGVDDDVLTVIRENFNCAICIQLPERPVTTPCGHNFCLKCFEKWTRQGKFTCVKCRRKIPKNIAKKPRINLSLVTAIRLARESKSAAEATAKCYYYISNQDRPDQAFTSERAVKNGMANATSGKIFVTIPPDHFGPVPAENDPIRNQGVLVGESWENRQACRQWGIHFPHVAGIAGQSKHGAQSVVLSGGYADDEDHGEWFLYTGSGGKDLSGNKRTNPKHTHDQEFTKMNEALRLSCKMGYPVRVVRSHKEFRSAYAPVKEEVRYDGVYRIEMCWRKICLQGVFKVCRYLFVRCDNEAAPWTSAEHGDRPRPLPAIPELQNGTDFFLRNDSPSWDFDVADGRWKWVKPPPVSKKSLDSLKPKGKKRMRSGTENMSVKEKLLKEFNCQICQKVLSLPVTTPCAHNFCKGCLEDKFAGITQMRERSRGGRTLRAKKNIMTCPSCPSDICDFLQNPEVNREMMTVIETLTKKTEGLAVDNDETQMEEGEKDKSANSGENNTDSEEEEEEEVEIEVEEEEEDEDEVEDEEEIQIVKCDAEEPPRKRVKLDTDTEAAATVLECKETDTAAAASVLECKEPDIAAAAATVLEESKDINTEATATVLENN